MSDCLLCQAARITPWHHEDDVCWVADCSICGVPMVVWKQHAVDPPPDVFDHLLSRLHEVAGPRFGDRYHVDSVMRRIPDHFHAHARVFRMG